MKLTRAGRRPIMDGTAKRNGRSARRGKDGLRRGAVPLLRVAGGDPQPAGTCRGTTRKASG